MFGAGELTLRLAAYGHIVGADLSRGLIREIIRKCFVHFTSRKPLNDSRQQGLKADAPYTQWLRLVFPYVTQRGIVNAALPEFHHPFDRKVDVQIAIFGIG